MYEDAGTIYVERKDQCYDCEHHLTGCPVIEGLTMGYFELDSDLTVKNCKFYTAHEGAQKIIQMSEFIPKD